MDHLTYSFHFLWYKNGGIGQDILTLILLQNIASKVIPAGGSFA